MPEPASPDLGLVTGNLLVAVDGDRDRALVVRQTRRSDRGALHALVLRADALPLVLVEVDIVVGTDRWEYRASGLWVEAVCEDPRVHWSYGLEAFALALDGPEELLDRGYGHRTPLGWELDFVSNTGDVAGDVTDQEDPSIEVGRVDGLLLTAPAEGGEQPFTGDAWRASWSRFSPDPWPVALPAPATAPTEVALPLEGVGSSGPIWWVGHDGTSLTSRWTTPGPA